MQQIDIGAITGVLALLIALLSNIQSMRKTPSEIRGTDAGASKAVAEAAASLVKPLQERLDCVEAEQEQLRGENKKLRSELEELRAENSRLRNWAERLIGQLQRHGIEPEPYEPNKPKPQTKDAHQW